MGKKKRKLIIKSTGAGDPTFFIKINIPLLDDESPGMTIAISILALLGVEQYVALDYVASNQPSIPLGEDITIGSSFYAETIPTSNFPGVITFSSSEYDFEIQATGLGGTIQGNEISFDTFNTFETGNHNLQSSNTVILETLENHDQGNFVFLYNDQYSLNTNTIFSVQDEEYAWLITRLSEHPTLYSIQNLHSNLYIGITNSGTVGLSSGLSDQTKWTIEKVNNSISEFEISISQGETTKYLYSDSQNTEVELSNNPSSWYFYFPEF